MNSKKISVILIIILSISSGINNILRVKRKKLWGYLFSNFKLILYSSSIINIILLSTLGFFIYTQKNFFYKNIEIGILSFLLSLLLIMYSKRYLYATGNLKFNREILKEFKKMKLNVLRSKKKITSIKKKYEKIKQLEIDILDIG